MANLDDLNYKSLTEMGTDEAIEMLRQIRLSRRIPVKKVTLGRGSKKKPKGVTQISANQAEELLKILTGG